MNRTTIMSVVVICSAVAASSELLSSQKSAPPDPEVNCLFLHSDLPVDVYAREGEYYLLFRGNATSRIAAEDFKREVEKEFPPGTEGITVEIRPYGIGQKVQVDYANGGYIKTIPEKNDGWNSIWIRSKVICPPNPQAPFATGVSFVRKK